MLHTIAHYAFIVALSFSSISGFVLLTLLAIAADWYLGTGLLIRRDYAYVGGVAKVEPLVWEIPALAAALSAFWGLVAFGLHLL